MPGSIGDDELRRPSAEIVAAATLVRHSLESRKGWGRMLKSKKGRPVNQADKAKEIEIDEHTKTIEELVLDLGTDAQNGMNSDSALRRAELEGKNCLTPPKQIPAWLKYVRELTGLFSLLLWAGALLCLIAYLLSHDYSNLYLGCVLVLVVFISGTFSYFQNSKSSSLMESFKNMMPTMITVIRDGQAQKMDAVNLVRGDLIQLKAGDKIPADSRIVSCSDDMQVDNAALTGESEPQKRSPECTDENPLETKNLVFFGTFVPQGSCTALVINVGDSTFMGRIARLAVAQSGDTTLEREIKHFVHMIAIFAVTLGICFFIAGVAQGTPTINNLVFMIGIIVANVPEGLPVTVTVSLTLAAGRMAKKSVLVKNLQCVETLGSTSCICSDKTGTLTQNIMTVTNIVYDLKTFDCESTMNPKATYDKASAGFKKLQRCFTLCNNAVFDEESKYEVLTQNGEKKRGNPLPFKRRVPLGEGLETEKILWSTIGDASESALIKFIQDKRDIIEYRRACEKIKEIPFNSKNKYQVSIHKQEENPNEYVLLMKGAPERIIDRCTEIFVKGEVVPLTDEIRAEVEKLQLDLSKRGMRVLGFAEKPLNPTVYGPDYVFNTDNPNFPLGEKKLDPEAKPPQDPKIQEGLCFIGLGALIDPPRPQVPGAVEKCKSAGIRVIMVTGDHPVTAKAIAHQVGILWGPTKEDIEEENAANNLEKGLPGWQDPEAASAIVVPGWDLTADMVDEDWDTILDHPQVVFARTSPQQKLMIVENCQRRGEIVGVTGDGVNDSPALKKADIGIAMGIQGSEVSKEAADMILLDDNFASIVLGVEEGRRIFDNLKKSISYSLAVNIPELVPFLLYITWQIPVPLSTPLMLALCVGTDMAPAISLAYEPAELDIMKRPPRNAAVDRLVSKKLIFFAYFQIGIIQAFGGMYTFFSVMNEYGYPLGILPGLGMQWGTEVLWCKMEGGEYCSMGGRGPDGVVRDPVCDKQYKGAANLQDAQIFWRPAGLETGKILDCQFPIRNFKGGEEPSGKYSFLDPSSYPGYSGGEEQTTLQSMQAAWNAGYRPYTPYWSRTSAFFNFNWLKWNINENGVSGLGTTSSNLISFLGQPISVWNVTSETVDGATSASAKQLKAFKGASMTIGTQTVPLPNALYTTATIEPFKECSDDECLFDYTNGFTMKQGNNVYVNVMSRQMQAESLLVAQTANFVTVLQGQWANVIICKTRWLSFLSQGFRNDVSSFALIFETLMGLLIAYAPFMNVGLQTRPVRLHHWFYGLPFALYIIIYDEARKLLLRLTAKFTVRKDGKVVQEPSWLERNTYY